MFFLSTLFKPLIILLPLSAFGQLTTVNGQGRRVTGVKVDTVLKENIIIKVKVRKDSTRRERVVYFPLERIKTTSPYGLRWHPVEGGLKLHSGIDLKASYEGVYAFADGIVEKVGYDNRSGNYLVLVHTGGIKTAYAHLSYIDMTVGEQVRGGRLIALSGNTGSSTAPHLHFAVKYHNRPVNPAGLFRLM